MRTSVHPSICPSIKSLTEAGSGLPDTGSGLPEAGSALQEAVSGPLEAGSGLPQAGSALQEAGSGLPEAGSSPTDFLCILQDIIPLGTAAQNLLVAPFGFLDLPSDHSIALHNCPEPPSDPQMTFLWMAQIDFPQPLKWPP